MPCATLPQEELDLRETQWSQAVDTFRLRHSEEQQLLLERLRVAAEQRKAVEREVGRQCTR